MELNNRDKTWIRQGQDRDNMVGTKEAQHRVRGLKKFSGGWWVGGLQVIIVSAHLLYDSFTPIYVRQD